MNVYGYQAALYCEECGQAIRARLDAEGKTPAELSNEYTYDSDDYPKGPFPDGGGEADSPQHCGSGEDCTDALELTDGSKVGAWLENPLTDDGVQYVREVVAQGGRLADLWAEWYREELE